MKYLHMRSSWQNDKPIEGVPAPTKFRAVSVGYTTILNPTDGKEYLYGQIAFCKRKDNFNRKLSHTIIEGRMNKKGPSIVQEIPKEKTARQVLVDLFHPDFGIKVP